MIGRSLNAQPTINVGSEPAWVELAQDVILGHLRFQVSHAGKAEDMNRVLVSWFIRVKIPYRLDEEKEEGWTEPTESWKLMTGW